MPEGQKMVRKAISLGLALLAAGCGQRADWTGFVYPDAKNLTLSAEIGRFDTFEQCRVGATQTLRTFGVLGVGTYECGRACRHDDQTNLVVCAVTRD